MVEKPLLSILIPTVVGREEQFNKLKNKLYSQAHYCENAFGTPIEFIVAKDNKEVSIGEKRNWLYKQANGIWSWMPDDDDDCHEQALEKIITNLREDTECLTFEEHVDMDGKIYKSNHSLFYNDWEGDGQTIFPDGFHFHRTPFFKSVIKTEIAKSIPIPHIRFGEDHQWAQTLKPHLKTEVHIPEQIYRYIHRSSDFNERYGIKD